MSDIYSFLREKGFDVVQPSIYDAIKNWRSWYDGKVKDFHNYRVFNGQTNVDCNRMSLGMAKRVCEDWANLLENEKTLITLEIGRAHV